MQDHLAPIGFSFLETIKLLVGACECEQDDLRLRQEVVR